MKTDIDFTINGSSYSGWESVSVEMNLDTLTGSFSFNASEKYENSAGNLEQFTPDFNDECDIRLDGETVITGFIDQKEMSFDADRKTLIISGRDKTGDIVDSSCVLQPDMIRNDTASTLVSKIAAPFGVSVDDMSAVDIVIPLFKVNVGEKAIDAINRVCSQRNMLANTDSAGNIVLRSLDNLPRDTRSPVNEGVNILTASLRKNITGRFSSYQVEGQVSSANDSATSLRGAATDENITRHRPLVVIMSGSATPATVQRRAEWEAAVRTATSAGLDVTLQGWRSAGGTIWRPGVIIPVNCPTLGVTGEYLIKSVSLTYGDSGTISRLSLTSPDAYKPKPVIPKKTKASGSSSKGPVPDVDIFKAQ